MTAHTLKKSKAEIFLHLLKTDEQFQNEIVKATRTFMFEKIDEDRRYAHYVIFTPILKQLWNKIRGKKPYKNPHYKPTI